MKPSEFFAGTLQGEPVSPERFFVALKESTAFLKWGFVLGPRLNKQTKNPSKILLGTKEGGGHVCVVEAVFLTLFPGQPMFQGSDAALAMGIDRKLYDRIRAAAQDHGTEEVLREKLLKCVAKRKQKRKSQ